MSVASEITRLQNAKASLKTSINAKNDLQHQITTETLEDYASYVDDIQTGGAIQPTKSVTINTNTTTTINPDSGYDGIGQVSVTTQVSADVSAYFNTRVTPTGGTYPATGVLLIKKVKSPIELNTTEASYLFYYFKELIEAPTISHSLTNCNSMFYNCEKLTTVPTYNTSSCTNFGAMFSTCKALTSIPALNTSSGTAFNTMCASCTALTDVPLLDLGKATNVLNMFNQCSNLTNLGGFKDLGKAFTTSQSTYYSNYTLKLSNSTKITHDSLMNVINNLYDIKTKGCNNQKIILSSTCLGRLSAAEIQIANNKGWDLTTS